MRVAYTLPIPLYDRLDYRSGLPVPVTEYEYEIVSQRVYHGGDLADNEALLVIDLLGSLVQVAITVSARRLK